MNPISIKEASQRLGIGLAMTYRLFSEGKLRGYRIGRRVLVYPDSIVELQDRYANRPPLPTSLQHLNVA